MVGLIALGLALLSPAPGFRVARDAHHVAWLIAPDGSKRWSFGVCVVDTGVGFDDYDAGNPAYAAWRYYPSKPAWAASAIGTLVQGGFNTVGAWSDYKALLASRANRLMMTPIIHSGSSAGFPWLDMWDPALVKVADDVTKGLIQSLHNDPRIIGYFSDNELGWWKPAIWDWIWKQKTHYERSRVVAALQRRYGGSWTAFSRDFDTVGASGWKALSNAGEPYLRANCRGESAITMVLGMLAERYYTLCGGLVKKYAPHALYLGDRYISNYYPEVAAAAGRHCDVVSTNLNPDFTDGSFVRYYLPTLETLAKRPLMITEYYMCAREGRSGNGNDRSGFPVVQTLDERADGFERTTRDLLADPDVVGAHWFQYYDEPKNGRGDGENYNFGLVDTANRPYTELLAKGHSLDLIGLHAAAASERPGPTGIPPAPVRIADLTDWNRRQGFVAPATALPRGDLYASWAPDGLHVAMVWPEERFGEQYFRGRRVPTTAETTVEFVCPTSGRRCVARLRDKGAAVSAGAPWQIMVKPDTTTRLFATIPAKDLGIDLRPGAAVRLRVRLTSENRAYTTAWSIRENLTD